MNDEDARQRELESRYRRLLRWYPPRHRHDHEEEMLGVLLQSARPGQARPSPRDAADIAWGGVLIRARRSIGAIAADRGWRDAFAAIGILLPLFMCVKTAQLVADWARAGHPGAPLLPPGHFTWSVWPHPHYDWLGWAAWPLIAALGLFGARRLAAGAAAATIAAYVALLAAQYLRGDGMATPVMAVWWPMLGLIAAGALAAVPGRRGLAVLGGRGLLAACGATAAMSYAVATQADLLRTIRYQYAVVPAIVVAAALYGARTPAGRKAVMLLLVPYGWFKATAGVTDAALAGHAVSAGQLVFLAASAVMAFAVAVGAAYGLERTLHYIRIGQIVDGAGRVPR
ncbi:MAG TPA: hypothetical protein VF069_09195 [Streptosporangiaceae bacterium]